MRFMRMVAVAGTATLAIAWAGGALADMTGRYIGHGDGAGATLDLQQTGNALAGTFAGVVEGALLGTTDGGDNATGVVLIFGVAKMPFTGVLHGAELELTMTGANGERTLVPFTLATAPAPTPPTKPVPQPTPVAPDADLAVVTEALRTLLGELAAAEFVEATAERRATLVECLMTVVSPLSVAELQMLVDAGFQPDDAMIAQFERTVPGIDAAVSACFAAVNAPETAPAPQPQPAPVTLDDAAVEADLRAVLVGVVAEEAPGATPERRAAIIDCLVAAVAGLPIEDRQHLVEIGFDPDQAEVARLETLLPGIAVAVGACLDD